VAKAIRDALVTSIMHKWRLWTRSRTTLQVGLLMSLLALSALAQSPGSEPQAPIDDVQPTECLSVAAAMNSPVAEDVAKAPVGEMVVTQNPDGGRLVGFDATGSYGQAGKITTWSWDFGDGTTGTGRSVMHTYAAPGAYEVVLVVTDDAGRTNAFQVNETVFVTTELSIVQAISPNPAPEGSPVEILLTITNDGDGVATNVRAQNHFSRLVTVDSCAASDGGTCEVYGDGVQAFFPTLNVGQAVSVRIGVTPSCGGDDQLIEHTITMMANEPELDVGNNRSSVTIQLIDNTPPTINCPSNLMANPGNGFPVVVNYPYSYASDNCDFQVPVRCSPEPGSLFPVGVSTVTCTATDAAGNTSTCAFTVTVQ
jgi:hypothetical protein